MSYTKKTWRTGDTITAEALNNLESGASANASAIEKIEQSLKTYVGADVPRKAADTITPGTSNQTIAANQYLTGAQTVKGDGNLSAENIKKGLSIFGVTGTLETGSSGGTGTNTSDATAEAADIVSGKTAYVASGKVTGTLSTTTTLRSNAATITETTNTSTVGKPYKDINVETSKITGISGKRVVDSDSTKIVLTTSASNFGDATAADVAKGKTFTSAAGLKVKGTKADSSSSGGGSGGVAVKTGTFTGNGAATEVDTGLSSILYFIAYDSTKSVHAEGLVVAIMDSAHSVSELGVSCSSYSQYFKNISVIKSGILTISGGTVSFPGASTTNAPISNTTYNWVAVGEA